MDTGNQRTIGGDVRFSGRALQTGRDVTAVCRPAEADEGIIFTRTDLSGCPSLRLSEALFSGSRDRRSTVGGARGVQTVEHFLAALWALGIDNIRVEVSGEELPSLDGSARDFFGALEAADFKEQSAPRRFIRILEEERVEEDGRSVAVFPGERFSISYLIDYKVASIGREEFTIELDRDSFKKEIAPARTFCLKSEAEALLTAGLGQGATLENTLVLDDDGPIGTALRFSNEPVRHKILDLVGDLYMLGRPVIGRVVAQKSGHALNAKMVRKIYEKYIGDAYDKRREE
ncbi:MAG: UDP-3-O-acyl-N-acetylglucosamine deacetylase [Candidatus Omnitrophota bacterium]|nr:UDP-3-O-acyl-N-acetylglucosamine deacetylase [Candidatus Omnitrophota bacterium]